MTNARVPMTQSGFCLWPGQDNGHQYCQRATCACECHTKEEK